MAITTLDGVIAGCEPPQYFLKVPTYSINTALGSLFNSSGIPGAAVFSTAGLGGEALTSYPGQIPFTNPSAGQKAYVARFAVAPRSTSVLTLCDRVWQNSGFNVTTTAVQNFTGCPDFNRDVNNAVGVGEGIFVALELQVGVGSTVNVSITYTNSAGVTGRTSLVRISNFGGNGLFLPFPLQAGDTGVRSIQSASIAAAQVSGAMSFVAFRPITIVGSTAETSANVIDPLTGGLPEIFNNSVLFLVTNQPSAIGPVSGSITFTKG